MHRSQYSQIETNSACHLKIIFYQKFIAGCNKSLLNGLLKCRIFNAVGGNTSKNFDFFRNSKL